MEMDPNGDNSNGDNSNRDNPNGKETRKNRMRDGFCTYHPIINIVFYMAVIGTAMFVMHPILNAIALFLASLYYIYLKKEQAVRFIIALTPIFLMTSIINPLFSHRGMTILCYLPTGNPLTLESIFYGLTSGMMLVSVILWFASFNLVITSEKILYFTGRTVPTIGMLISMVLRFIPKYNRQARKVAVANKALDRETYDSKNKLVRGAQHFNIMTTWALENAVMTADSMTARGYGTGKRTSYVIYKFAARDFVAGSIIVILLIVHMVLFVRRDLSCTFYPMLQIEQQEGVAGILSYIPYTLLCLIPMIVSVKEDIKWHSIRSKI